jgi:hypothetical protein
MVTVLADQDVEAPHLEIPARLQAVALEPAEGDQGGLGRVLGAITQPARASRKKRSTLS